MGAAFLVGSYAAREAGSIPEQAFVDAKVSYGAGCACFIAYYAIEYVVWRWYANRQDRYARSDPLKLKPS